MSSALLQWFQALEFLRPLWLLALLGAPVAWWAWRRRAARASPWHGVVDPGLQPHVLDRAGSGGARFPWRWFAAYLLAVLALAGPAWQEVEQPLVETRDALVVVLDLSSSSRAADLPPDRAARARLKLARLLELRKGGQLGVLAFAGSAHVVSPLTGDSRTLRRLVDALEPGLMPVDGHRVDLALERALSMLRDAGETSGRILLVTDRADDAAVSGARAARDSGFSVHVLGLGTVEGAPVRAPSGGFSRDTTDRLRMARLQPAALERLAAAGGGRYTALRADDGDLQALGLLDAGSMRSAEADAGRRLAKRRDEGFWLVLLMLPLLLPEFRRGAVLAFAVVIVLVPSSPALAMDPAAIFKRDDQRAWQALAEGDAQRALELARDPALRGAAAFRHGDLEAAIDAFAQAGGAQGLYNRGNALAAAGRYEEALASWQEALQREPGHEDASANIAALEDWLEQQAPPPEQEGDESGEGEGEGEPDTDPAAGDGESDAPPREPDEADPAAAGEDGAPGDSDEDASAQERGSDGDTGDTEPAPPDEVEAADRAAAEQAVREAIEQALRDRAGDEDLANAAIDPQDAEALAERESAEAIERWLRLVDDDPGALLRRKFMIEHQRRERLGGN